MAISVLWSIVASGWATAQTRAGTPIINVAQVQASVAGTTVTISSNTASFLVAERLAVELTAGEPRSPAALPATLVNRGNGDEAFVVSAGVPAGMTVRGIAIDGDGDGAFDPQHDAMLVQGTTPPLGPGASLPLLVLVAGDAVPGGAGDMTLVARPVTGAGAPGTAMGAGDGGSDAVSGPTGVTAHVELPVAAMATTPAFLKSQAVRAPDGSDRAVAGAVVTYTLQASFADARRAARIDDPIPAGTRYVAGSLSLDGTTLTDVADADAGAADGASIGVALGDVAAPDRLAGPVTHTVRFQVVLQ